jgi:hypothetical protein
MTPKTARKIIKRVAADEYASIYDSEFRRIAKMAFLDGMVFWDMVKAGAVTEDMIDKDFFQILNESNHKR